MNSRRYRLALYTIITIFVTRQIILINELNIITRMNYSIDFLYIFLAALIIIVSAIIVYVLPSQIYIKYHFRINLTSIELSNFTIYKKVRLVSSKFRYDRIYKEYQVFRC